MNTNLFGSAVRETERTPVADTTNKEGAVAFSRPAWEALVNLAFAGTFPDGSFYDPREGESQLRRMLDLAGQVNDPVRLAKLAVASRHGGYMKDMPMALLLLLSVPAEEERMLEERVRILVNDTVRRREVNHRLWQIGNDRGQLFSKVFDIVVDNAKVLKTMTQMLRSGLFGRRSMSYLFKRKVGQFFNCKPVGALLSGTVGGKRAKKDKAGVVSKPIELADVLGLARPVPADNVRRALFGWLTDSSESYWKPATRADLPRVIHLLEDYRRASDPDVQAAQVEAMAGTYVRWDLLAGDARGPKVWKAIARHMMGPQALRMNLNTLHRQGVFDHKAMVDFVADQLSDTENVRRSRQFPYTYFLAYKEVELAVPHKLRQALCKAADAACVNIPALPGPVIIGVDRSGSMNMPATGNRGPDSTSKLTCAEAAALFAAVLLKRNPDSALVPFSDGLYPDFRVDPDDTVLSIAERIAALPAGATDIHLPISAALGDRLSVRKSRSGSAFPGWPGRPGEVLSPEGAAMGHSFVRDTPWAGAIILSDNESWLTPGVLPRGYHTPGHEGLRHRDERTTYLMHQWSRLVQKQRGTAFPSPKLVCYDLQCYGTTQAPERQDVLNLGGFSDFSWTLVADFFAGRLDLRNRFGALVDAVSLDRADEIEAV